MSFLGAQVRTSDKRHSVHLAVVGGVDGDFLEHSTTLAAPPGEGETAALAELRGRINEIFEHYEIDAGAVWQVDGGPTGLTASNRPAIHAEGVFLGVAGEHGVEIEILTGPSIRSRSGQNKNQEAADFLAGEVQPGAPADRHGAVAVARLLTRGPG